MSIATRPASRFAWPGAVVKYHVRADRAAEIVLPESPCGLEARIRDAHQVDGALEADIEVSVRKDASMD